jgi:hypothetical protein
MIQHHLNPGGVFVWAKRRASGYRAFRCLGLRPRSNRLLALGNNVRAPVRCVTGRHHLWSYIVTHPKHRVTNEGGCDTYEGRRISTARSRVPSNHADIVHRRGPSPYAGDGGGLGTFSGSAGPWHGSFRREDLNTGAYLRDCPSAPRERGLHDFNVTD